MIVPLTETALYDQTLEPDNTPDRFSVYRSDGDYQRSKNKGTLIAVGEQLQSFRHRDLEIEKEIEIEKVWLEVRMNDGTKLLEGNHYFSPDSLPVVIEQYLKELEKKLEVNNCKVIMLGDFDIPGVCWYDLTCLICTLTVKRRLR